MVSRTTPPPKKKNKNNNNNNNNNNEWMNEWITKSNQKNVLHIRSHMIAPCLDGRRISPAIKSIQCKLVAEKLSDH
jgi:hypothetical protein